MRRPTLSWNASHLCIVPIRGSDPWVLPSLELGRRVAKFLQYLAECASELAQYLTALYVENYPAWTQAGRKESGQVRKTICKEQSHHRCDSCCISTTMRLEHEEDGEWASYKQPGWAMPWGAWEGWMLEKRLRVLEPQLTWKGYGKAPSRTERCRNWHGVRDSKRSGCREIKMV